MLPNLKAPFHLSWSDVCFMLPDDPYATALQRLAASSWDKSSDRHTQEPQWNHHILKKQKIIAI